MAAGTLGMWGNYGHLLYTAVSSK